MLCRSEGAPRRTFARVAARNGTRPKGCDQVRGRHQSQVHCGVIESSECVDECKVLALVYIEVGPIYAVDERVRDVQEGDVHIWIKLAQEQREDVLGADALESGGAAVDVRIDHVWSVLKWVSAVAFRGHPPYPLHQ